MKEKFLPIGTVVLLKKGDKHMMITGYCGYPTNNVLNMVDGKLTKTPAEKKMYDYCGCGYPEGILGANMASVFNHDDIKEVVFVGYETEDQKGLSDLLNSNYDKIKEQFEKGNLTH